jgi:hypothetical protein
LFGEDPFGRRRRFGWNDAAESKKATCLLNLMPALHYHRTTPSSFKVMLCFADAAAN